MPTPKAKLSVSPAVEAVLRGAIVNGPINEMNEDALKKCTVKGWIQFSGDDGENVMLTATGRQVCDALGFK